MPAKAMMAVGSLVISPTFRYQQARFPKYVKQPVTSHGDSRRLQLRSDQIVQLARPDPWLPHAAIAHQRQCFGLAGASSLMPAPRLIERLSTDAEMAASPCHAYAFEAPLREDLPEGFFTMRTP